MVSKQRRAAPNKKRHGKHQNHTKDFLKVYWPYMPLLLIVSLGMMLGLFSRSISHRGVLAYATSMSQGGLLSATNQERATAGVGALSLNSQLNQAAQAKANDMVARDYWSHNTPEGSPPWVFIDNAGYDYKKAGENLAYGFATSADVIQGWMTSTMGHKENMLLADYVHVGFGYANSANYQGAGPQTVVVAMYGEPMVAGASSPPPAPAPSPTPPPSVQSSQPSNPTPTPTPTPSPAPEPEPQPEPSDNQEQTQEEPTAAPVTSDTPIPTNAQPVAISQLATITRGQLAWLSGVASGLIFASVISLVIKHGLAIRKWLIKGERYVLHHMLFDVTVISLIGLCVMASRTAGYIL